MFNSDVCKGTSSSFSNYTEWIPISKWENFNCAPSDVMIIQPDMILYRQNNIAWDREKTLKSYLQSYHLF